jgi:hypothetical protein
MEKTAEDIPQRARKIVPAASPFTGRSVMLIPKKQYVLFPVSSFRMLISR